MKTLNKTWIAGLVMAGFACAAVPSPVVGAEPPLRHPSDHKVTEPSHSPADLDLTRKIRDALVANDKLSNLGKNVVIDVTLTGTVIDLRERTLVGDIASRVAGQGRVENELEFLYVS